MGFAPASRLIATWWAPRERGRAFGVINFAAGFSSVLTFGAAAFVLTWLSWRWVLRLPVLLLLAGAAVVWLFARDRPEELGLSSGVEEGSLGPPPGPAGAAVGVVASLGRLLRAAFANPPFLLASVGFGFANWARLGLLVWVPSHLLTAGAAASPAWMPLALPVGMAVGALFGGYAVDRFLGGDHPRMIVVALALAAGAALALLAVPPDGVGRLLLFAVGFLVFAPFPSFTVLGAELLGPRSVGAGVGFMNGMGYGTAALGDVITGAVIDATGGTGAVFAVAAVACVLGAVATALAGAATRRPV
jgi:OPA family glycerol-3-phosphate transporter-like MFS transporter